jgi:hypothetical protein
MRGVFDEISKITTLDEVEDNEKLYDFIKCAIKERQTERVNLFEMFFITFFPTAINIHHGLLQELLTVLAELIKIVSIRDWIVQRGHVDKLVSELVNSRSFDMAGINTEMILGFLPLLSLEQLNTIIEASISNDQIHFSFKAKRNLKKILTFCEGKVNERKLKELRKKLE